MWPYKEITRVEFEKQKDFVEDILRNFGVIKIDIELLYTSETTTICCNNSDTSYLKRTIWQYGKWYYRLDEILFPEKPFIVFECANNIKDVQRNIMEDLNPFPHDLSEKEIKKEILLMLSE